MAVGAELTVITAAVCCCLPHLVDCCRSIRWSWVSIGKQRPHWLCRADWPSVDRSCHTARSLHLSSACLQLAARAKQVQGLGFWNDEWQRPQQMVPGLQAAPWWQTQQFALVRDLEENYEEIKREMYGLSDIGVKLWSKVASQCSCVAVECSVWQLSAVCGS